MDKHRGGAMAAESERRDGGRRRRGRDGGRKRGAGAETEAEAEAGAEAGSDAGAFGACARRRGRERRPRAGAARAGARPVGRTHGWRRRHVLADVLADVADVWPAHGGVLGRVRASIVTMQWRCGHRSPRWPLRFGANRESALASLRPFRGRSRGMREGREAEMVYWEWHGMTITCKDRFSEHKDGRDEHVER
jgi:hypothetical protein